MAEIVGTVASIVQLVQLSGSILVTGYGYLSKVSKAPSEIRELLTESAGLNCVLGQLQHMAESSNSPDMTLYSLLQNGVFNDCYQSLDSVKRSLEACEQIGSRDARNLGRRLVWPFKEKEAKSMMQRIGRLRALLSSALNSESALAIRRIEAAQAQLQSNVVTLSIDMKSYVNAGDLTRIASWLCPPTSYTAQDSLDTALRLRSPDSGKWVFKTLDYTSWLEGREKILWVTGLPGSGKTVLSSTIITNLQTTHSSPFDIVLFFFCDHRDESKMTLKGLLMNLTRQLFHYSEGSARRAKRIYDEKARDSERTFNDHEYLSLLQACLNDFRHIFIVVDALDEASEKEEIAESIGQILRTTSQGADFGGCIVKILLTSREDAQVRRVLRQYEPLRVTLDENGIQEDIEHFIAHTIHAKLASGKMKLRDGDLITQISKTVQSRAGTFLQVKLQLDMISTSKNDKAIKLALQNLPNGLSATYEEILQSALKDYPSEFAEIKTILQWLVASVRPLSTSELAEVISFSPGDTFLDFDAVSTDPEAILEPLSQLITIEPSSDCPIVRLSHFSIQEFLIHERLAKGPAKAFYIDLKEAHIQAAERCLQYLTFSDFDKPLMGDDRLSQYAFLEYAAFDWPMHIQLGKLSQVEFQDRILPKLDWFLEPESRPNIWSNWQNVAFFEDYPPLLLAISEGLTHLVDILLPRLADVDHRFPNGLTCLSVAAEHNQVSIAKQLLARGASVDKPTKPRLLTPLHLAAEFAHAEMVELLLSNGASIHARSNSETTPFYRAARGGSLEIIRLLHDKGSEVDAETYDKWTPLMDAVANSHGPAVELLLELGADPTHQSDDGESLLEMAKDYSYPAIEACLMKVLSNWPLISK